jgi:hypothetical protein
MGTMTVRVTDREAQARAWGSPGYSDPIFRTVTISDRCATCGGPRGEVYTHNFHEDGGWYYVDRWNNPCGHIDTYTAVLAEADRRSDAAKARAWDQAYSEAHIFGGPGAVQSMDDLLATHRHALGLPVEAME